MKKHIFTSLFVASLLVLGSCVNVHKTTRVSSSETTIPKREYSVQALLWQQNAGEYRALCYQAFNLAQLRLDEALKNEENTGKKLAIITDIDETVIDNSPYNAKLVFTDEEYTKEGWIDWGEKKSAKEVPGAAKFLNYAHSKGVEVFYVSNRFIEQHEVTLENMKAINFPYADDKHLLLMTDKSSKQARFEQVLKDYEVILYLGDNLTDFSEKFNVLTSEKRNAQTDELMDDFGKKFIVFPNPMYGDWETKGIYEGNYQLTDKQKEAKRKANLKAY